MKKIFVLLFIMSIGVITSSCVNMFAVKELNESAVEYINKGDYESAIARLESSVDLDGNSYETRYNLAYTYLKADKCDKALENIDIALKLAKVESPSAYYTKAVTLVCLAENIYKKTDENGEKETIEYKDADIKLQMEEKFVNYLMQANENYSRYLELAPDAKDAKEIQAEIERNNLEIDKLKDENKSNE